MKNLFLVSLYCFMSLFLLVGCVGSSGVNPDARPPKKGAASLEDYNIFLNQSLMIPPGKHARHLNRMIKPRYVTIHSTQNRASSAGARMHARALYNGNLKSKNNAVGYLSWHYTVDQSNIYQHLPDTEEGQHADYEGPGNKKSIGIEMCENAGTSREATLDRTARLTAYLMRLHRIPLDNVVPHQHWRRIRYSDGRDLGHKNCPHFLMDNGKPGPKWEAFKGRIRSYLNK